MRQCISVHGLGYEKMNLAFWCIVQSISVTGSGSRDPDRSNWCAKKAPRWLGCIGKQGTYDKPHAKYRTSI
jgi:hypothetical protein